MTRADLVKRLRVECDRTDGPHLSLEQWLDAKDALLSEAAAALEHLEQQAKMATPDEHRLGLHKMMAEREAQQRKIAEELLATANETIKRLETERDAIAAATVEMCAAVCDALAADQSDRFDAYIAGGGEGPATSYAAFYQTAADAIRALAAPDTEAKP